MAKIILGERPKNFKLRVTFKLLDGSEGKIELTSRYRTRTEYAVFVDAAVKASREAAETALKRAIAAAEKGEEVAGGMQQSLAKVDEDNVQFILGAAEDWDLDQPFDLANVRQLADEYPQAVSAIVDAYRVACTEGRLGN